MNMNGLLRLPFVIPMNYLANSPVKVNRIAFFPVVINQFPFLPGIICRHYQFFR